MFRTLGGRKALLLPTLATVAVGTFAAVHFLATPAGTHVLGEKVTGSGSSTTLAPASANSNSNAGGNGNGNGNTPASKTFSIGLDHQADEFGPGTTTKLYLAVDNTTNQGTIRVTALSASLLSIAKASTNHFAGACTANNSGVTIQPWTGQQFAVDQGATVSSTPGYIPVTLSSSAPDACQDATFNFSFSGTAVK